MVEELVQRVKAYNFVTVRETPSLREDNRYEVIV